MSEFSRLDCVTGEQILNGVQRNIYVLIPQVFGGGHIKEPCYDGFGHYGGKDIYELAAIWNKDFIPKAIQLSKDNKWPYLSDSDIEIMNRFYNDEPLGTWISTYDGETVPNEIRDIGLILSDQDKCNELLPYPIKITHYENAVYEDCGPSKKDPYDGWSDYTGEDYESYDEDDIENGYHYFMQHYDEFYNEDSVDTKNEYSDVSKSFNITNSHSVEQWVMTEYESYQWNRVLDDDAYEFYRITMDKNKTFSISHEVVIMEYLNTEQVLQQSGYKTFEEFKHRFGSDYKYAIALQQFKVHVDARQNIVSNGIQDYDKAKYYVQRLIGMHDT